MREKVPTWAIPLKASIDTKPHVSSHVLIANWAMCLNMLPPDLVWWTPS